MNIYVILVIFGIILVADRIRTSNLLRQQQREIRNLRDQITNPWIEGLANKVDRHGRQIDALERDNDRQERRLNYHTEEIRKSWVWHNLTLRDQLWQDITGKTKVFWDEKMNQTATGGNKSGNNGNDSHSETTSDK